MASRKTFREVAEWMDDRPLENKVRSPEYELRSLAKKHSWLNFDENKISYRKIIERHKGDTNSKEISFLFYNTWLIDGFLSFGAAPFLSLRANLIGKEIKNSGYDVAALCEVFEDKYKKIIRKLRFPYDAVGPVSTPGSISSGLYTLSKFPLGEKRRRFENAGPVDLGGLFNDNPDYNSNKGVLYNTINLGIGKIDLYTTHLFWGSGEFNPIEKTDIQLAQLKELTEFIKETHNPKHVVVVAGDMNINPGKSHVNGGAYEKMRDLLSNITIKIGSKISLEDLWKIKGGKRGGTNTPTQGCPIETRLTNPTSGILYCNDDSNEPSEAKNEEGRYDYIFVQKPTASHDIIIDYSRMKRRPFPFPELKFEEIKGLLTHPILIRDPTFLPALKNMNSAQITEFVLEKIKQVCKGHLSDHIGVDVKMLITKKS